MRFCFYKFNNDLGVNTVGKSLETWLILMVCLTVQVKTHLFCTVKIYLKWNAQVWVCHLETDIVKLENFQQRLAKMKTEWKKNHLNNSWRTGTIIQEKRKVWRTTSTKVDAVTSGETKTGIEQILPQRALQPLFIIAKRWKQSRCPSVGDYLNKPCCIQTIEH